MFPTLNLIKDYIHFVLTFFEVISTSALHIYISALPLSPKTSIVHKLYKKYACPSMRVVHGLPASWEPVAATMCCNDLQPVAAWSPCNRFIAVAKVSEIEILDGVTLKQLSTIGFTEGRSLGLCFSSDGHTLIHVDTKKAASWDFQTGGPLGAIPLEGLRSPITAELACSADGRILAVVYLYIFDNDHHHNFVITIYNLPSEMHINSYNIPEGEVVESIWAHGACFHFASKNPHSITIWEVTSALVYTPPTMVEFFPVPDEMLGGYQCLTFWFLPTQSQLVLRTGDQLSVWDTLDSKFVLKVTPILQGFCYLTFSLDGYFLGWIDDMNVQIWRKFTNGYMLHQKFPLPGSDINTGLLFSPNGESVLVASEGSIHVWHTRNQVFSGPNPSAQRDDLSHIMIVFSPDETLAAFAWKYEDKISIINLWSGDLLLTIDAGIGVEHLGMTDCIIGAVGDGKVIIWNVPAVNNAIDGRLGVNDGIQTGMYPLGPYYPIKWISPDCSHVIVGKFEGGNAGSLQGYNASTGKLLTSTTIPFYPLSFAMHGSRIFCKGFKDLIIGWSITEDELHRTELESLETTGHPQVLFHWQSHSGYKITDSRWILGPTKKHLLWLPQHWRLVEHQVTWSGRFFGWGCSGQSQPIILGFLE